MQQIKLQHFAIKRILRDVQEVLQEMDKLPGISACIPNPDDPYKITANILVLEGVYRGLLVPITIVLPANYPLGAPAAYVVPKHPFNHSFHEHIVANTPVGASICTDLTSNYATFFVPQQGTGWNPAYAIQSILLQLQVFFSQPDLSKYQMPSPDAIEQMMRQAKKFEYDLKISDANGTKTVTHSYKSPYPALSIPEFPNTNLDNKVKKETVKPIQRVEKIEVEEENKKEELVVEHIEEISKDVAEKKLWFEITNKLICPITKNTIFHEALPVFGYPIAINKDRFGRIWATPIIEVISKEGIEYLISQQGNKISDDSKFKSIFGAEFTHWLPLYVNKEHFKKSESDILFLISSLANDSRNNLTFKPASALQVLLPILVKTAIHFLKGDLHQSYAAIDAYCQFYWLLINLIQKFPEIQDEIDHDVELFSKDPKFRHKRSCGDLGEFMIKLSLSKYGIYNQDINKTIFYEFLTRQVSWTMKANDKLSKYKHKCDNLVDNFISAGATACQFFLLQFETAKLLVNDKLRAELEERYGFISDAATKTFRDKLIWIQNNMTCDWNILVKGLSLEKVVESEESLRKMIVNAFSDAEEKYYDDVQSAIRSHNKTSYNSNYSYNNSSYNNNRPYSRNTYK